MANNDKENKIEKFTKEAIGKTLNQFNKEIGMADLVEVNKNQDRILNGILSQVNDENTEKIEKSNIITLDNSTDGIVELKEIQGDTNVNVSKIEEMPITHDIGDKEGNVFTLNEIPKGAISIGEIQGNTMVNCNKDDKKELVLMKDLSTQGDNNITLTEGVDGGKVDVALEGNTLVNVSKTKDNYITHEREEDTTGNHIALADEGYIRPVLNGKTMVNVCDQKDPIAVTKSYTVENSGNHIALQGEYDGKCRPVITGKTLVNIINPNKCFFTQPDFATRVGNKFTIDLTESSGSWVATVFSSSLFKADTVYTLIINVIENTLDKAFIVLDSSVDNRVSSVNKYIELNQTGLIKTKFTSKSSLSSLNEVYMQTQNNVTGKICYEVIGVLEGDYTDKPIPDYFEGLQSTFEDNLVTQEMIDNGEEVADNLGKYRVDYKATGKNKFNINTTTITGLISSDGSIQSANDWRIHDYMDIKPNTEYTLSEDSDNYKQFYVAIYDKDKNFVSKFVLEGGSTLTFTTPSNSYFYRMGYSVKVLNNAVNRERTQLEEGNVATEYEPYKEGNKTLYLNSPLLEGDTIEQYGNNIVHVHRYGKVVLDGGTSPWGNTWWESTSNTTDTVFSGGLSSAPYEDIGYCDKFPIVTPSNLSSYDTAITIDGESIIRINIPKELLSRNKDLSAFRTWLNANPITLVGKLKTPQYEVISTNDELLADSYVNGHLDFESAVPVEKVKFDWVVSKGMRYLYPSTTYDIYFESDNIGIVSMGIYNSWCRDLIVSKGKNKVTLQFGESIKDNRLIMDGIGFNASNIVVTPAIEQDFGYFSGLSSTFEDGLVTQEMIDAGEEEVDNLGKYRVDYKVTGKNKFDIENINHIPSYMEYIKIDNGFRIKTLADGIYRGVGFTCKVKPNTDYIISFNKNFIQGKFLADIKDLNDKWLTSFNTGSKFNSGNNEILKFNFYCTSDVSESGEIEFTNIQIEESDTATSYEPYKEYTKTLYLNSPLLEGDTIEEKNGGIYHVHRSTKVVLDVGNPSPKTTSDSSIYRWFMHYDSNMLLNPNNSENKIICNKYPTVAPGATWGSIYSEGICVNNGSKEIFLYLDRYKDGSSSSKQSLIEELRQNPAVCVYKLETPQYELIEQSNLAISSYSNGHLDLPSAVPVSKVNFLHFEEELTYLYPSTSYTVQFVSDKATIADINLGGTHLLAQSITQGLNRIVITTPATLLDNKLVISGVGAKISEVVVTDTDREFKYFEGMKSVGECEGNIEILSHNGNLYKRLENSYYKIYGSGVIVVEDNEDSFIFEVSDWDKGISYLISTEGLFKNKKYKLTWEKYNELAIPQLHASGITLLNSNKRVKEQVSSEKISNVDWNFELPDNFEQGDILEIRFKTSIASGQNGACNICINEVGVAKNTALSKLNKQQITHEPLRAVGDAKDRYVLIDGKWYIERNVTQLIINKDVQIVAINKDFSNTYSMIIKSNNYKLKSGGKVKSDLIKFIVDSNEDIEHCRIDYSNPTGNLVLWINKNKFISSDIADIIEYFKDNPISFVCELATPTYEPIDYNPFTVYSDITHISNNSTIPANMVIKNTGYNCLLKPSTTYTVSSNLGLNVVTTPSELTEDCLRFMDTDTSDVTTMRDVLVLEGDWTSKADLIPSNFSGIESAFEQELVTDEADPNYGKYRVTAKVVGKNLFNINQDFTLGYINHETGEISLEDRSRNFVKNDTGFSVEVVSPYGGVVTDFIRVSPNTSYKFSAITIGNFAQQVNMCFYDCNKKIISGLNDRNLYDKFNTPKDCCYIRIGFWLYATSQSPISYTNMQLEQGDTATAYEPYKESNITFYINEPLRGLKNSKDRVFIQDDKVVVQRNCSSVIFNGTENWGLYSRNPNITFIDTISFQSGFKISNTSQTDNTNLRCNLLPNQSFYARDVEGIFEKQSFRVSINKYKLSSTDVNGWKEYLSKNNMEVVYPLETPTYEEVEYSSNRLILNTFNNESFNNSTLFLDTNISPKLSFKPLYEELVYVKNSTKYYIQFNAVGSGEVVINLGGTELTTEIVEGHNCISITTPSESTNLMVISGQGITISEVIVSEVVCGGYYKGLQSCFEEHMENGKYRVLLRGIALDGSKVNGIKLYINEPLRGIGDTKDRLCIKNGKLMVERKCGEEIFDGSDDENWRFHKLEDSGKYAYVSGKSLGEYETSIDIISNVKTVNWYNSPWTIAENIISIQHSYGNIYSYSDYINLNDFKSNLKNNPIIVVYPKDTIIYEEATNEYGLPIVFEGYENGIVYIDSAVTPTTHIKYTSNNQLATTLSEAEEQNIATQEDINMNVITYMMDIDMILTDMEMSNDISVMAVRRDSSNENMLDRMSDEDKKVYRDNTVVMLEKMITANVLEKEDIEGRIDMYYNKNRISKEQYKYLKSLL